MNVKQAVARRIELLCKERGIAYNELANICGVTPSTIILFLMINEKILRYQLLRKYVMVLKSAWENFFRIPFLIP